MLRSSEEKGSTVGALLGRPMGGSTQRLVNTLKGRTCRRSGYFLGAGRGAAFGRQLHAATCRSFMNLFSARHLSFCADTPCCTPVLGCLCCSICKPPYCHLILSC